ncbi:MAG: hypothetical protein KJ697_01180 [Nanoarchaeota archaeon]|nr:hypothetical protein [Nanoarchaeota archaeon]MBU4123859.1 hypothetical protein [Nanoarchaeota archaeon]
MQHKSMVNIFSGGASYKSGPIKAAFIEGNGYASSTDLHSLQCMSEGLTPAVGRNNDNVYKLIAGD